MSPRRVLALLAVASLGLTACGGLSSIDGGTGNDSNRTIVIAHTGPKGNSVYDFFERFADLLEERSEGRITVEVHPAGELGGDQELVEALRIGSVDIASAATSNMASYTDAYEWADLPYVFADHNSALRVWKSDLADDMDEQVSREVGTHVLGYLDAGGFRVLANSKRPVRKPADTAGLKLRTTGAPLEAEITRTWGANPVPVPWEETFSAMEQGVVDGLQLQPEWLNLSGYGTVVDHATRVDAVMTFHVVQASELLWADLSSSDRELVREVAIDATAAANAEVMRDYQDHLDDLADDGVQIYRPTTAEVRRFESQARATWEAGDDDLLRRVLDVQGRDGSESKK